MADDAASAVDPFAGARANIRDTVKWLAAAFAALLAATVGTSPMAGLGKFALVSPRFWVATVLLAAGFACICAALWATLRILRPGPLYRSDLTRPLPSRPKSDDDREIAGVRETIDAQAGELLPFNYKSLADIGKGIATARQTVDRMEAIAVSHRTPEQKQTLAEAEGLRAELNAELTKQLPLALYLRLQQRLARTVPRLLALGVGALVFLTAYGVAVTPQAEDKKPETVSTHILQQVGGDQSPAPPSLPKLLPVLFSSGSAELTGDGLSALQAARDALLKHPDAVLLISIHTDTEASNQINAVLARRRADAVVTNLSGVGGIAGSRLFVALLPKQALPVVTADGSEQQANRTSLLKLVRREAAAQGVAGPR